ncbi:MipA/OmpV family protein [Hydrogenophaga sp. PAMC20947]|uniref:MipA/OmpV family protein n=1 Tax=Hydrogenophaga sp. PAMC20947 TaxID=2565558 RepID=UPI00109DB782|nr:MipA/OmpV family protein [Hydrogenophaga sp. PAMC20947]QCB47945.1 MipA/OmpV family protein [Hydrogenophaga sp. PAMC20947]
MSKTHAWLTVLMLAGFSGAGSARAEGALSVPEVDEGYLIGASMASSSGHVGNAKQRFSLKPMWAFQVGSVRISRSRANSLMSAGREKSETGLSTNFDIFSDWKLGASLRIDNGRSFDGDPELAGLPDVRTTLRARTSLGRSFGPNWSWSASVDQDLLGREGGLRLSQGVGYRWPVSEKTYWDLSMSTTWGNGRYLQTQYGISNAAAMDTGRQAYLIGSGWESFRTSVQFTHALSDHWVAFGGLDLSQLLRGAAHSPLVGRVTTHGLSVGVAYRSK